MLDDLGSELAVVQLGGATLREQLERPRQLGLDEHVADGKRSAVVLVHIARLRRVAQDQVEDPVQVRLAVVELDAVARELDRRLEEVAPGEASERLVRRLEPECRARNRAGGGADVKALRRAAAEVDVDVIHQRELALVAETGDRDEEVEYARALVARAVHEHEAAGARPGERAFRDPGDERGSDGGVDCVAAGLQDACARLRGLRVAACDCPSHGPRVDVGSEETRAGRSARISVGVPQLPHPDRCVQNAQLTLCTLKITRTS